MRKIFIRIDGVISEKNANEYNLFPKTNNFVAEFDGKKVDAAFTAGKGKSAIPNYYLYFRDETNSIFYFRSNPGEIEKAVKGFEIRASEFPPVEEAKEAPAEVEAASAEPAETPAKRRRERRAADANRAAKRAEAAATA